MVTYQVCVFDRARIFTLLFRQAGDNYVRRFNGAEKLDVLPHGRLILDFAIKNKTVAGGG